MNGSIDRLVRQYGNGLSGRLNPYPAMEDPSVSVVIPAYNEAGFIGRALDALDRQSYKGFDVLVVDDGSTDSTAQIAEEKGCKVAKGKKGGVSAARNRGYKSSRSDVVLFVDADTELSPNALDEVRRSVRNGYIGGTIRLESDGADVFSGMRYGVTNIVSQFNKYVGSFLGPEVAIRRFGTGAAMYCRRDVLRRMEAEQGMVFDRSMKVGEDNDMLTRMRDYGSVDFIDSASARTSGRRYARDNLFTAFLKDAARKAMGNPYPAVRTGRAA